MRTPTRAETEVRGPDEFPDVDWAPGGQPFYNRVRVVQAQTLPVIAAGVCPACGEVGHTQEQRDAHAAAGAKGYACQVDE